MLFLIGKKITNTGLIDECSGIWEVTLWVESLFQKELIGTVSQAKISGSNVATEWTIIRLSR